MARARREQGQPTEALVADSQTRPQGALASRASGNAAQGRLHWRGRELSPEFHEYALRVARGENLAPFRGRLLADESQPLPWDSVGERPLRSKAPRVVGLLLLALGLVAVAGSLTSQQEAPTWNEAALVAASLQPASSAQAVSAQAVSAQAVSAQAVSAQPVPPVIAAPLPEPSQAVSPEPVSPAPVSPAVGESSGSSEVSSSPVVGVPPVVSASPPPVSRQLQPRKPVAPVPAAASAEPSKSALLVEKPPF